MDQPVLMTGSDNGNRLDQDNVLCMLLLNGVNQSLQEFVALENRKLWAEQMREVKELAAGMKEVLAGLRKDSANAKGQFMAEATRAKVNAAKVRSLAVELSEANKEVEEFLGESGSNFPLSEASEASPTPLPHADVNGVTINQDSGK